MNGTNEGISPVPVKYAGFWIRYIAVAYDGLVLAVPIVVIQFIISHVFGTSETVVKNFGGFVYLLIIWIYFISMTASYGATLGKMAVGICVKSNNLEKISLGKIILRETVGKFVSGIILFIGYIIAGFTPKKRALHDIIARSVVVYKDPSKKHTAGIVVGIILAFALPVLAIIGIVSSIVFASLSVIRLKSEIQTQLQQDMPSQTIGKIEKGG